MKEETGAKENVDCGDGGAKLSALKRVYRTMGEFGFLRAQLKCCSFEQNGLSAKPFDVSSTSKQWYTCVERQRYAGKLT